MVNSTPIGFEPMTMTVRNNSQQYHNKMALCHVVWIGLFMVSLLGIISTIFLLPKATAKLAGSYGSYVSYG